MIRISLAISDMLNKLLIVSLVFLTGLFAVNDASAQIVASPRGGVSQTIDGTTIDIQYSRPALKGREIVFGDQVWWGHIWTPGADAATTIEVNNDITISGTELPAGKYSIWMVVADGDWEVILDPDWDQFHLPEPDRTEEQITFWVTPDTTAAELETLTFDFPTVGRLSTVLQLHWDNTVVLLPIEVPSRLQMSVTEVEVAAYLGSYETEVFVSEWIKDPFSYEMKMEYVDGGFKADVQFTEEGRTQQWDLLPRVEQIFYFAFSQDGEITATTDIMVEFLMDESGTAASFEVRMGDDELWMRGTRIDERMGSAED